MSSAAVLIGAFRVKGFKHAEYCNKPKYGGWSENIQTFHSPVFPYATTFTYYMRENYILLPIILPVYFQLQVWIHKVLSI